jgi:taurine dioxygenase
MTISTHHARAWTVDRLTGSVGAQVSGVDIRHVYPDEVRRIKDLIYDHGVLFFCGQSADPTDLVSFASLLGPVLPAHPLKPGLPNHPAVLANETGRVSADDVRCRDVHNRHATNWHLDCTFMPDVPTYSLLQAEVVPPAGGDTLFADLARAYLGLSQPLRTLADGLFARHDARLLYGDWLGPNGDAELRERLLRLPVVRHPLVTTHHPSGRRSLLLNPNCITGIEGLSGLESDTLLGLFINHALIPERTVRWRWSTGDIAVWDNVRLLHNYVLDHGAADRKIYRVMAGSGPLTGPAGATAEVN